jgi:hypothetical protein
MGSKDRKGRRGVVLKRLLLHVPKHCHDMITTIASVEGFTKTDVLAAMIEDYFYRWQARKPQEDKIGFRHLVKEDDQ